MLNNVTNVFQNISAFLLSNKLLAIFFILVAAEFIILLASKENKAPKEDKTISGRDVKIGKTGIVIYCIVASLMLMIPFTAMILRKFQTVFFQYEYLWALVPVVPVTAYLLVELYVSNIGKIKKATLIACSLFIAAILLISGNRKTDDDRIDLDYSLQNYEKSVAVMEYLSNEADARGNNGFTILAPAELTEYIHIYCSNVKTLYGKDMWAGELAPYNYTVYPEDVNKLYSWTNLYNSYGTPYAWDFYTPVYSMYEDVQFAEDCGCIGSSSYVELARDQGVDAIIFPVRANIDNDAFVCFEETNALERVAITTGYNDLAFYVYFLN